MAKFRMVHTEFWDDPKVVEEMTPEDKLFFLYLLTNSNTTQIGIYQITKKQMAFDIGYSIESVNSLLDRFISHHKLVRYNPNTREIALKNWGKYNFSRGGKPVIDCVISELKQVKDKTLIPFVGERVEKQEIKKIYDSYYDTCNDSSASSDDLEKPNEINTSDDTYHDTTTISGQEEEKEEEKEKEEEIYTDQVRALFEHYVSKGIIVHKKMTTAMRSAIKSRLKDYGFDELKKAIDNYAFVVNSPNHFFDHKYPLADFMRDKDVRRFLDEADPLNNFLDKFKKGSIPKKDASKPSTDYNYGF